MRQHRFLASLAGVILAASALAPAALAQGPRLIEIAPGDSIRLVHQSVIDRTPAARVPGKRLDVRYATTIPAADRAARLAQADRVAEFFGLEAEKAGARRLSVGICDTQECVQKLHPPSEWHMYERSHSGWRRVSAGE